MSALTQSADPLQLDNAHDYLDRVIRELHGLDTARKHPLLGVLQYLSNHIRNTRTEIGALRPGEPEASMLSSSADELEEIVAETARAANEIMGAAETIETLCGKVDSEASDVLLSAVTRIYEASAFQDITGQRITKVVRALQHIEEKLTALVAICDESIDAPRKAKTGDESLLNGPQLAKNASSQTDIDKLFDSLG
ncbi:MAG TPA: protein phosphatase CheZ [Rhizomicrobium sp.]|nr:protein phosphatase CheZ [Rhizomicrobium sp.]